LRALSRAIGDALVAMIALRAADAADLVALTDIYNHYVVNTAITFDLHPFAPEARRPWFEEHSPAGRHRLLVAIEDGTVVGYATTGRWRAKAAYTTTVEASVYCRADAVGRGIGTRLYEGLFEALLSEDIHRIVAGVSLPNPGSIALHQRFGFRPVGVFSSVGRKFDRYWDVAWFERPLKL
jgi:phosphinothricin acetyltransferase